MASDFRFLHAADLHLDSPLRGLARRGQAASAFVAASRQALDNLVSRAISEEVAFLIIAGDVYDGDWRDYATGQFFVRQMGRLARAEIRVFIIRGNHDADCVITKSLPLPQNVHSFSVRSAESVEMNELGVVLHGRGFAQRHVADNVALGYPQAVPGRLNIGVLHTSLTGRDGHDVYAPCSIDDLRSKGYDYWALGHIHAREVVAENPHIVFPGNLQGRHARETGPKGATLVSVREGRITALDALTLDVARFETETVDLAGVSDVATLIDRAGDAIAQAQMAAEGRPLALRLRLTGQTALHDHIAINLAHITEEMQARAFEAGADILIEKVQNATTATPCDTVISSLTGFGDVLAAVAHDPAFAAEISRTLGDLRRRAPPEALELLGVRDATPEATAEAAIAAAQDLVLAALNGASETEEAKA